MARVGVIAGSPWSITRWTHSLAGAEFRESRVFEIWVLPYGGSHCRWRLPRGGFMGFVGGFMGQNVRSGGGLLCRGPWQERCTDARPGSKPRTTHPVHLWLIKCTEAGPGWSPVPARLGLCGTPLRTSLRHACDCFPARFQLVSSSVLSSVAFPVRNR